MIPIIRKKLLVCFIKSAIYLKKIDCMRLLSLGNIYEYYIRKEDS